jgi:hypothetical protein
MSKHTKKEVTQKKKKVAGSKPTPKVQAPKPKPASVRRIVRERNDLERDKRKTEKEKKTRDGVRNVSQRDSLSNWKSANLAERKGYNCDTLPYAKSVQARHLSSATMRYAATLADPTMDLSIVHPIVQPTYEAGMVSMQRMICNFTNTCSTGSTQAMSFGIICPGYSGPYSDRAPVYTTNGSFIASTINVATGVAAEYFNFAPYNTGYNDAEMNFRTTACIVRIRNVTPSMYRGGSIVLAEAPGHVNGTFFGDTYAEVASMRNSTIYDLNIEEGEYLEIIWHPQDNLIPDTPDAIGVSGLRGFTSYDAAAFTLTDDTSSELCFVVSHPKIAGTVSPQELQISVSAVYEMRGERVRGKQLYRREAEGAAVMDAAVTDLSASSGVLDSAKTWHDQAAGPLSAQVGRYVRTAVDLAKSVAPIATDVLALLGVAP